MKRWIIKFKESSPDESEFFIIDFFDFTEYNHQIFEIADVIIEDIIFSAENFEHYHILHNIEYLKSSENENFSKKNIVVILGTNILEQKFGLLFLKNLEKSYRLLALWPEEFLLQFINNNSLFIEYLGDIVNNPTSFYDISIVLTRKS